MAKGAVGISMVVLAMLLVGCGNPPGAGDADLLYLSSPKGVSVIEPGATSASFTDDSAMPSRDWATMVHSQINASRSKIVATDPSSGRARWIDVVPGRFEVKLVSDSGDLAALSPVREPFYGSGRTETKLAVVGRDQEARHFLLDGNFEPEAFSTDGDSLFVVSYVPARAPTRYQVRRLDLTTGRVEPVYTPHAELQGQMGGTARVQTSSPDGSRLYTLYTVAGAGDTRYAFVHVLDLDELWAHCIDLPQRFAPAAGSATALSVSPDGGRLYVANSATDSVAAIDTETFAVEDVVDVQFGRGGPVHATPGGDSLLYLTDGPNVIALDAATLEMIGRWSTPDMIKGLQVNQETSKLFVGLKDRIVVLDAVNGERLDEFAPPGVKRIRRLGPTSKPVGSQEEEDVVKCAC